MRVVEVDPLSDPVWQRLVEDTPSNVFHSPQWLRGIQQTYGMVPRANVVLDEGGHATAGLPFVHIADIRGERIVALPFSDYCDPIVDDPDQWRALIDDLIDKPAPIVLRCLHNTIPLEDERFKLDGRAKWHGMDLQVDEESLWMGVDSSARRAVRKAEKSGVQVRVAETKDELRAFFELHLRVRKYKYDLLAQPYRFFENIWDNFVACDSGVVMLALYNDKIIGGVFFLEWKDVLVYKFSVSDAHFLQYRPADAIVWEAARYARRRGLRSMDFGLSDWDQDGLIRFKRKFASEEKTLSFLRRSVQGVPTEVQQSVSNLLPHLTALFTNEAVPDDITEKAGDLLYRFFS